MAHDVAVNLLRRLGLRIGVEKLEGPEPVEKSATPPDVSTAATLHEADVVGDDGTAAQGGTFAAAQETGLVGIGRKTRVAKPKLSIDSIRAALDSDALNAIYKTEPLIFFGQAFSGAQQRDVADGAEIPDAVMKRFDHNIETMMGATRMWATRIDDQPVFMILRQGMDIHLEIASPDGEVLDFANIPPNKGGDLTLQWGVDERARKRDGMKAAKSADAPTTAPAPLIGLAGVLERTDAGYLVYEGNRFVVASEPYEPRGHGAQMKMLQPLTNRREPTVAKLSGMKGPFAMVFPPNFRPVGQSYQSRVVVAPPGRLDEVVAALAKTSSTTYLETGEFVCVVDPQNIQTMDPKAAAWQDMLRIGSGIAFNRPKHTVTLGDDARGWVDSIRPKAVENEPGAMDAATTARWKFVTDTRRDLLAALDEIGPRPEVPDLRRRLIHDLPEQPQDSAKLASAERTATNFKVQVERLQNRGIERPAEVRREAAPTVSELTVPKHVPSADAAKIRAMKEAQPHLCASLQMLMDRRPDLFEGADGVTQKRFADQLSSFVDDGHVKGAVLGFAQFITRIATREFRAHVPGWSHTHGIAKGIVMKHPGLVLDLIRATRDGRAYPAKGVYEGDGRREVPPSREFHDAFGRGPGQALNYEMGFLRAMVEVLAPGRTAELHPDLIKGRSAPAAIGAAKLTGIPFRYNYADKIRTGDDLVEAIALTDGYGIAMGDIGLESRDGVFRTHFGYFSDFDPETRTVNLDDFLRGSQRIRVDGLQFKGTVACYHIGKPGFEKFLTPQLETRLGQIMPSTKDIHPGPLA